MKIKPKKLTIISLTSIIALAPITTAIATTVVQANVTSSVQIKEDAFNYVLNNSLQKKELAETDDSKWSLTLNSTNEIMYFDSPQEMQTKASSFIKQTFANTSYDLVDYVDPTTGILGGSKEGDDLWKHLNLGKQTSQLQIKTVYRGENGQIFDSLDEAKKSYLQLHEAYYFNDIYFNDKEELRKYLLEEYFNANHFNNNAITLKAPNQMISAPIKLDDPNFDNLVTSFVKKNTTKVLKYDRTKIQNNQSVFDKTLYFTSENYKEHYNELNLNDLDYQYIASNQGKSQYILDTSNQDEHNLLAPYIYEGTLDIGAFSNKENWKKVNNSDDLIVGYQQSVINSSIGSFFSFLLLEDQKAKNVLTPTYEQTLFNVPSIKFEQQNLDGSITIVNFDKYYLNTLKYYSPKLYQELMEMYSTLVQGKRYNAFYKIPILYSFIMQRIVSYNMPQVLLNLTVEYFSQVCDYLQDGLETIILQKDLLRNFNQPNLFFNLKEYFHIGDPQYDISTSVEAYMEMLKRDYPLLSAAISIAMVAINDFNSFASLVNSYDYIMGELKKMDLINKTNKIWFDNNSLFLHNIYSLFLHKDLLSFSNFILEKNNFDLKQKHNKFFKREDYIETLSFSLHSFLNNANAFIQKDLEKIVPNKPYNGILRTLKEPRHSAPGTYDPNLYFAYPNLFLNRGQIFIDTIQNTNYSLYQLYLLLVLDNLFYGSKYFRWINGSWQDFVKKINELRGVLNNKFNQNKNEFIEQINKSSNFLYKFFESWSSSFVLSSISKYEESNSEKMFELIETTIKIASTAVDVANTFKTLPKVIPIIGPILDSVVSLVQALIPKLEKFYYVYTTSNNDQFYWDGGSRLSTFFNTFTLSEKTNENMKLLKPIQLVLPQMQDVYYYDAVRYFSPEEIKRVQLKDMITNLMGNKQLNSTKRFSYQYTFDTIPFQNSLAPDDYTQLNKFKSYSDTNQLIKDVLTSVKNNESKYIHSEVVAFTDGFKTNSDLNVISHLTQNVIDNIRSTWIALKPKYDSRSGYPIKTNANQAFVFPNKSWSSVTGLYINKHISNDEYFIDNSANNLIANYVPKTDGTILPTDYLIQSKIQASDLSRQKVYDNFMKSIDVETKQVLTSEYISKVNFDKLNDYVYKQKVYQVILPNKKTEYFIDIVQAQRWLAQNLKMRKIGNYRTTYTYEFAGKTFSSIAEMKKWTYDNIDLVNAMRRN